MFTLADIFDSGLFFDTLAGHAIFVVYLFVIMGGGWKRLRKLPVLLLSPFIASILALTLYKIPFVDRIQYYVASCAILLMCTLWTRWAWRTGFWCAFAAACMAAVFQETVAALGRILFHIAPQYISFPPVLVHAVLWTIVLSTAALLYCLHFGTWFRLLMEARTGQCGMALFFLALLVVEMAFFSLQKGVRSEYLVLYYLLMIAMTALMTGLVTYLAKRSDADRKLQAQQDVIAQQQIYERDLESVRLEVRSFRHDYKNLLAGLSMQAAEGNQEALRESLSKLDAGLKRRIGEKVLTSVQIGNLRIPQVRSLLLSKLADMGEKGVDCRLEVLYPVESLCMDVWDFVRCLGVLLDNAVEAALETDCPQVEIVLLNDENCLSLWVTNPYTGIIQPDKIWSDGFSTKGTGRGLGLPGYQRILMDYPNVSASTRWAGGIFVQELNIGGRA